MAPFTLALRLLNLCKTHNMYTLNGRVGDENVGKLTCKHCSVVDYAIGTCHIFKNVFLFKTCDSDPLFSDVHCALIITLGIDFSLNDTDNNAVKNRKPLIKIHKWSPENPDEFFNIRP